MRFVGVLILIWSTPARTTTSVSYTALRALYEATNGTQWRERGQGFWGLSGNAGWLNGTDPCTGWQWVNCSVEGDVTELMLGGNNLGGTLPSQA